jgi:DNA-binding transcriptional ArsR family regulator
VTAGAAGGSAAVLSAMADPHRVRLLEELASRGSATATVLAEVVPVSRQAVVKHLAVLSRSGLVSGLRQGREMRYSVRTESLVATAQWLAALAADWDTRLAELKRLAEGG